MVSFVLLLLLFVFLLLLLFSFAVAEARGVTDVEPGKIEEEEGKKYFEISGGFGKTALRSPNQRLIVVRACLKTTRMFSPSSEQVMTCTSKLEESVTIVQHFRPRGPLDCQSEQIDDGACCSFE